MAKTKKSEPKNKIGEVEIGTILYESTGTPLKVLEYNKAFGGRVKTERADSKSGEPKWFHLSKLSTTKKLEGGGGVGKFFNKASSLVKQGFDKTKKATQDAIHNQKKKVALQVMEETKNKVSSPKDKMALNDSENIVADKFKKGGKVKAKKLLKPKKPTPQDLARKAKRTGYRFKTDHLKNKDGTESKLAKKLHYKKPTNAEIEKYKKNPDGTYPNKVKEIYHERRADRTHSDDSPSKKFDEGGKVEKPKVNEREGWLTIKQVEEKIGRKLHWWNDDMVAINSQVFEKVFLLPFYKPVKKECDVKEETKIEPTPAPIQEPAPAPIRASEPTPIVHEPISQVPPPIPTTIDNTGNLGEPTV